MAGFRKYWKRWLVVAVVAVAVLATAGPYVYINYIHDEAPAALSLDIVPSSERPPDSAGSGGQADGVAGRWRVSAGSQAGYRVDEVLFGQNVTAVGRTDQVTGELTIEGSRVVSGTFTVDLASVRSDSDQRDSQFRDRIMNTDQFPNATFALTAPVDLGSVPAVGAQVGARATGDLTIHGETKSITIDLTAQRTAGGLRVNGTIPVTFADYGIDAPNFGGVTVEDDGNIEFLLAFAAA